MLLTNKQTDKLGQKHYLLGGGNNKHLGNRKKHFRPILQ